jgi:hypothetical protein
MAAMKSMRWVLLLALGCVEADYSGGGALALCPAGGALCPAGQACAHGYCTPTEEPEPIADGGSFQDAAPVDAGPVVPRDCQAIKAFVPAAVSGTYTVDPDGPSGRPPLEVRCDMETAGGGWTRVINFQNEEQTWNAWDTVFRLENSATSAHTGTMGLALARFSYTDDGEDLEYLFAVDNRLREPIYRRVNMRAWDPARLSEPFDQGFEYRTTDSEPGAWEVCNQPLQHAEATWNWSIAQANTGGGCNGTHWGNGFLLEGTSQAPESGDVLHGLNAFHGASTWYALTIYTRRTP